MIGRGAGRPRLASAILLGLALVLPGCGRPGDENWLRVVRVQDDDGVVVTSVSSVFQTTETEESTETTTESSGGTTETTTESTETTTTATGSADYVTVVFVNQSTIPGSDDPAGGVTIDRARITYKVSGYSLPEANYAVTLYIPADDSEVELRVPLVSATLKSWLVANVPASVRARGLSGSARLAFHAATDQGGEVEAKAGVGIAFVNQSTTSTTTFTSTTE